MAYLIVRAVEDDADWKREWHFDRRWNDLYETSMLSGGPLVPELETTLPRKVIITHSEYWPDFLVVEPFFVVTRAAMEALKSLEPHAHQYFEIGVEDRTGTAPRELFLLHCTNRIQPIIINRSDVGIRPPPPPKEINGKIIEGWRQMFVTENALNPHLVLDRKTIGNRHLWKGPRGGLTSRSFVSNAFKARLDNLKPGVRYVECEEVVAGPDDRL